MLDHYMSLPPEGHHSKRFSDRDQVTCRLHFSWQDSLLFPRQPVRCNLGSGTAEKQGLFTLWSRNCQFEVTRPEAIGEKDTNRNNLICVCRNKIVCLLCVDLRLEQFANLTVAGIKVPRHSHVSKPDVEVIVNLAKGGQVGKHAERVDAGSGELDVSAVLDRETCV